MNPANDLLQSLLDWIRYLPTVEEYDKEEYTTERSIELNGSLETTLRRATLAAQKIRRMDTDPLFQAELQRLADALVALTFALRRYPGSVAPPRPEASDLLRLLTPSIQDWLRSSADVDLLRQLP